MTGQILATLLGVWLMAAPAVLRYGGLPADHDHVVGPVIATFACVAIWEVTRPLRWCNVVLGAWLLLAPWLIYDDRAATLNSLATGLAVVLCSLHKARLTHSFAGGWSSLWRRHRPAPAPAS